MNDPDKKQKTVSIKHLEDLKVSELSRLIDNLTVYSASEKLDGMFLELGRDLTGAVYVSRELKGGLRYYNVTESPWQVAVINAMKLIWQFVDRLTNAMAPGEAVSLEVILGSQPNAVVYGKDGLSYVVVTGPLRGENGRMTSTFVVNAVQGVFGSGVIPSEGIEFVVSGEKVQSTATTIRWMVLASKTKMISGDVKSIAKSYLRQIETLLSSDHKEASKASSKPISHASLLNTNNRSLFQFKKLAQDDVKKLTLKMTVALRHALLSGIQMDIQDKDLAKKIGFVGREGVVLRNQITGDLIKLIDRDEYDVAREFFRSQKEQIQSVRRTNISSAPIQNRGGFVGDARGKVIRLFGIPDLDLPQRATGVIMKFDGMASLEILSKMCAVIEQNSNIGEIKRRGEMIINKALVDLDEMMAAPPESITLRGKKLKYSIDVERRTLIAYVQGREQLQLMKDLIVRAPDVRSLVKGFLGKSIMKAFAKKEESKEQEQNEIIQDDSSGD